jgi:diaminopimelate decarboxylase
LGQNKIVKEQNTNGKKLPLPEKQLYALTDKYQTPFHIYDEQGIRRNARSMYKAFSWMPGFLNYFAVKALPNPFILKILKDEGMGADCSSLPELLLAQKAGITGKNIMFTSNDTPAEEFKLARKLGAIINLDDISHISALEEAAGLPELVCFRYNPGPARVGNAIIGDPKEAKYGFTRPQLFEGYRMLREKGVKRFGLHTMVASNELREEYFIETARMLFELVAEVKEKLGITIEFVNLGGGIGIPYRPEQKPVDLDKISVGVRKAYAELITANGIKELRIVMECGRYITGPYGFLVSRVRHVKHIYKDYVGLDACMANLMRPALYGAYHHITVLGKSAEMQDNLHRHKNKPQHKYDVTGSLCENNDKFAIDRMLPEIEPGDIVVIHDTGAHGHAMGFNYNGKLRSAELLLRMDKRAYKKMCVVQIRRAETADDYFATLDFWKLNGFR